MCKKCNKPPTDPCCCTPNSSILKEVPSDSIIYSGIPLTCSSVPTGMPLTEALQMIDDRICAGGEAGTTTIANIGTGQALYAGDSVLGVKQFKTLKNSSSIDVNSGLAEVTPSVNETWLSQFIFQDQDRTIVAFNTTNPNTGSPVFTPNTPQDDDVLYWSSVNNSYWIWNGTTYVTEVQPNNTPFFLSGTTTDAGGNKLADIKRTGKIGIGVDPLQALHVLGTIRQSGVTNSVVKTNLLGDLVSAVAGTDYLTPTGSAALLTSFPTLNQNTTGNAATVTTNANLTGDVTSVGNATTLSSTGVTPGSYTSANITVDVKGRVTSATSGGGSRSIADIYTDSQNTGSSPTDLYLLTIPANTLQFNGDKLHVHFSGQVNSPGVTKNIQFSYVTASINFSTTSNGSFFEKALIVRTSASTVRVSIDVRLGSTATSYDATWTSIDFTVPTVVKITGTATSTGDIIAKIGTVSFEPRAV